MVKPKFDPVSNLYTIDITAAGRTDYQFTSPDFNTKELLSNLVLKWEYIPGSFLYLVWSQSRNRTDTYGTFSPTNDMSDLFSTFPRNVRLIKFSNRFSL